MGVGKGISIILPLIARLIYGVVYWFGCSIFRPILLINGGSNIKISPTASIKFPQNIELGTNVFINHNCCVWASQYSKIKMGCHVLLGPGVVIVSSNHGIKIGQPISLQAEEHSDVIIGSDVWIGANTVILPGVEIGSGCVIGAGSVVSRSLPENTICVGVPAKPLRRRE